MPEVRGDEWILGKTPAIAGVDALTGIHPSFFLASTQKGARPMAATRTPQARPVPIRRGKVLNTTIPEEAFDILYEFCPPGRRATGVFLGRLLFEHKARLEARHDERQRLRNLLQELEEPKA
jgi:hypothetical protein